VTAPKVSYVRDPRNAFRPTMADMNRLGFTITLIAIALSPLATRCQTAPQGDTSAQNRGTAPTPISAGHWQRVLRLPFGQEIVVANTSGPPIDCEFAGANDATLLCGDPEHIADTGFQFERSRVLRVDVVRKPRARRYREWHFHGRFIADAIVGTVVGMGVGRGGGAKAGVLMGLAGALVTEGVADGVRPAPTPFP